ncbi:MAG: hypothetical protein DRI22_01380 [Caldiserica bacterium]|nr:MAG: hypothetical protein DRI22_01380 [Caldisericota bacterium]
MDIEKIIKELDELNRRIKRYVEKRQEITGTLNALKNTKEEIIKELRENFNIDSVEELDREIERIEKEIVRKKIMIEESLREIDNELNRKNQ